MPPKRPDWPDFRKPSQNNPLMAQLPFSLHEVQQRLLLNLSRSLPLGAISNISRDPLKSPSNLEEDEEVVNYLSITENV